MTSVDSIAVDTARYRVARPTGQNHRIHFFFLCALPIMVSYEAAQAQLFERALVVRGARIVTMVGEPITNGAMVVKGGRIEQIGSTVDAPFLARTLDVTGKTITPGFIDPWSALGRLSGNSPADPTARARDGFDRYAHDAFQDALRNGITTFYLGTGNGVGITGVGEVVRLIPGDGGAMGDVVAKDAALCINLDSQASAISRLKTFRSVRKQFQDALDYRQAVEDYQEELEQYLKKLEERREGKEKEEGKGEIEEKEDAEENDADKDDDAKPTPEDKPTPTPPSRRLSGGTRGTRTSAPARARGPESGAVSQDVSSADNGDDEKDEKEDEKGDGEKKEGDDEEELEKPTEPTPDRKAVVLLRAIDRELSVRIRAHRSADIFNALALAEEFNLDIILEGVTEARLVADQLAEAGVPVVLGPAVLPGQYADNEYRRHSQETGDMLSEAGVEWTVSSGGQSSAAARFTALNAQLATGHNRQTVEWMRLVTTGAAKVLAMPYGYGRLVLRGYADYVIWSGDPGDPASIVEQVYVAGKLAYQAKSAGGASGGGR